MTNREYAESKGVKKLSGVENLDGELTEDFKEFIDLFTSRFKEIYDDCDNEDDI